MSDMNANTVRVTLNVSPAMAEALGNNARLMEDGRLTPYEVNLLLSGGPTYFNPVIGSTPKITFGRINDIMGFLTELEQRKEVFMEDHNGALQLINNTVWAAAQFWRNKLDSDEVDPDTVID